MAGNNYNYNPYGYTSGYQNGYVGGYANNQMNMGYNTNQYVQQNNQNGNSGNLMTISVTTEEEVQNYPVAAGVTVLLISFNLKKFWLKSTNTSGIPEPIREFPFEEKTQSITAPVKQESQEQKEPAVTREEFAALAESVKKLINDLGGENDG